MILGTWELYRIAQSLRIVFRRRQRREQVRFGCLAPAAITTIRQRAHLRTSCRRLGVGRRAVGRQRDRNGIASCNSSSRCPGSTTRHCLWRSRLSCSRGGPTSREDGGSARPSWRWTRASRDNLVRYCYVVHPCERLRKSRLEAQDADGAVTRSRWLRPPRWPVRTTPTTRPRLSARPPADGPRAPAVFAGRPNAPLVCDCPGSSLRTPARPLGRVTRMGRRESQRPFPCYCLYRRFLPCRRISRRGHPLIGLCDPAKSTTCSVRELPATDCRLGSIA